MGGGGPAGAAVVPPPPVVPERNRNGNNPADVAQVGTVAVPVARPDKKLMPQPTDKDTLIVDQVLFKGAVDLLKSDDQTVGMGADNAVELVIQIWEGVRARHNPKPQPVPEQEAPDDNDDDESFGAILIGDDES